MRPGLLIALALTLVALGAWHLGGGAVPDREEASPHAEEVGAPDPVSDGSKPERDDRTGGPIAELRRAIDAGPGVTRRATATIGGSAQGRPIRAMAMNGLGAGPLVLVVGCIHGTECAGVEIVEAMNGGGPPDRGVVVVVPDLNPDGRLLHIRLNARGVDLNRNFASDWRPIGAPGNPEHSGPRPFSEPETQLARRLIRGLRPDVTIWFHQQEEPLVRAWGQSVAAAQGYARLARAPFHRLPWLGGTAPNWQNSRFSGTSSFVVELPLDEPSKALVARHARAITRLGRELRRGDE